MEAAFEKVTSHYDFLDVRLVCEKKEGQWALKLVRVIPFEENKNTPNCIEYSLHLFLSIKMKTSRFNKLLEDLKQQEGIIQLEGYEIKHKKLISNSNFSHIHGNGIWGVTKNTLPMWHLTGNWENYNDNFYRDSPALISLGDDPFFPSEGDGQAWFLYNSSWDRTKTYPILELAIFDNRAYIIGVDIEGDTYVIRCKGELLTSCKIELYTSQLQLYSCSAKEINPIKIESRPNRISFFLTYRGEWLDRRDIDLTLPSYFIPSDINYQSDEILGIKELISRHGESKTLEFKEKLDNSNTEKNRLLQTIVAFANTEGGRIILGVTDEGIIKNVELKGLREQIQNIIEVHVDGSPTVDFLPELIDGKNILIIQVHEGIDKPYALNIDGNKPLFYVRRDASNRLAKPDDIRRMLK